MARMETDYSKHAHFQWKIRRQLEHLSALGIMRETAPLILNGAYFIFSGKSGCSTKECLQLVEHVLKFCPRLHFVGLMTIGEINYDWEQGPNPDFVVSAPVLVRESENEASDWLHKINTSLS